MSQEILRSVEAPVNENIPNLRPGDLVSVHVRIKEGLRERVQEFRGTMIREGNSGNNASFTIRRLALSKLGDQLYQYANQGRTSLLSNYENVGNKS